jgi:hemerythrin-like domain-containing protein
VLLRSRLGALIGTEEQAVYTRLARDVGALDAQAMVEEHQEIRHWLQELVAAWTKLERPSPDLETVRSILFVLVGLIRLHLRREDNSYLRMLAHDVEARDAARHRPRVPQVA